MSRAFRKPVRPVLNRKHALARGLIFAAAPGWDKGYNPSGVVAEEDIARAHGDINGSLGGTFDVFDGGRTMTAGASVDGTKYGAYAATKANVNSRSVSCAILTRPRVLPGLDLAEVMLAKSEDLGPTFPGYRLNINNAGGAVAYEFAVNDGVGTSNVRGTNGTPNVQRTALVVGTFGIRSNDLKVYVDGRLENSVAATRLPANNTFDVSIFATDTNTFAYDGIISMAAIWNRELAPQEVAALWTDPYILWKPQDFPRYLGFVAPTATGTYFLIF